MSKQSEHDHTGEAPDITADAGNGQPEEAGQALAGDHEAFLRLAEANGELNDRLLRLAADMENLRKRTARDVQDARAYAISAFARDMLGVADNLRRALDAIPADQVADNPGLTSLKEGVEMTARDLHGALERHGVRQLEASGQPCDPNMHQAVFEVENPSVASNTVVEVIQEGYMIGERVLRPAMVGVAKGGPKAAPAAEPRPADDEAGRNA